MGRAKGRRAAAAAADPDPAARLARKRGLHSRSPSPIAKRTRLQKAREEAVCTNCCEDPPPDPLKGGATRGLAVVVVGGDGFGGVGGGAEGVGRGRTLGLLELPPEVRLLILEHCAPYREISRLRAVCHAFYDTCSRIVKAGFLNMQEQVSERISALERQAEALLAVATENVSADASAAAATLTAACAARRNLQRNLQRQHHLRLLTFQLQLVRALTWRYVEAGAVSPPYAQLLDTCGALLHGGERWGLLRPRAHVHTCRNIAMRLLKNFLRHVQQRLGDGDGLRAVPPPLREPAGFGLGLRLLPPRPAVGGAVADVVLPCSCVIELLEASLSAAPRPGRPATPLVSFRPAPCPKRGYGSAGGGRSTRSRGDAVRVQARYDLEGCWLGVYSGKSPHGALRATDIHLLTSILCDLVCSSCESRLLGLRDDSERATTDATAPNATADPIKLPTRGRPPFCVYPRLHNPRQCYRGSIREPSGRVFAFGHAPGERHGLRVFLDLTASVSLVPASLLRRLTPDAGAATQHRPGDGPLWAPVATASEPFISKVPSLRFAETPRPLPFEMELVFESNAERVVYRSNA